MNRPRPLSTRLRVATTAFAALACVAATVGLTVAPADAASPYVLTTIAGNGTYQPESGNGGQAIAAAIAAPRSLAVDPRNGDLYFSADTPYHNHIRKITKATGVITNAAGNGVADNTGDGNLATGVPVMANGLAVDSLGNLFISTGKHIRRVDVTTGIITTFAGSSNFNPLGDGGPAIDAVFETTAGIAFDSADNLYVVDYANNRVRRIDRATATITTVAGTGVHGYNFDNRLATTAQLGGPWDVFVGPTGDIFITDSQNARVRRIDHGSGKIFTVAGTGIAGYNGDNRFANTAQVNWPSGITVDDSGNVYFADYFSHRIRKVDSSGVITTFAGTGTSGFNFTTGGPTAVQLSYPFDVEQSTDGSILIADAANSRIRQVRALADVTKIYGVARLDGNPQAGVHIVLYADSPRWVTVASTITAADGTFQFSPVPIGDYRVRLVDFDGRFQSGWLHGKRTQPTAGLVSVGISAPTMLDINLTPASTGAIVGDITGGPSSVAAPDVWVQVLDTTGFVAGTKTDANGHFRVGNLLPGVYNLRFTDLTKTYSSEWYRDAPLFSSPGRASVAVSGGPILVSAHLG